MEFDRVSRAVVLATVFSAIRKGQWLVWATMSLNAQLVLLIMLTTMCAMIPFVGRRSYGSPLVCISRSMKIASLRQAAWHCGAYWWSVPSIIL